MGNLNEYYCIALQSSRVLLDTPILAGLEAVRGFAAVRHLYRSLWGGPILELTSTVQYQYHSGPSSVRARTQHAHARWRL